MTAIPRLIDGPASVPENASNQPPEDYPPILNGGLRTGWSTNTILRCRISVATPGVATPGGVAADTAPT